MVYESSGNWVKYAYDLIVPFEGLHLVGKDGLVYPYLDKLAKPHVWTRGYGRTYGITQESPPITKAEAGTELEAGILTYGGRVLRLSPVLRAHPRAMAAVTSWCWNCGLARYESSRLRRAINEGRWDDAEELILKPDTAGGVVYRGLQRRRKVERAMLILRD